MRSTRFRAGVSLAALIIPFTLAHGETSDGETVLVTGKHSEADLPNKIENVEAAEAKIMINVVNTEDMLKYLPSIVVRKRHIGDTQDPLATRTNGVGASARSLLYVDGILISSPIGNNNTTASPHFGIAQPQDIANFQVLYGPFAAEYGGSSIGAVLNITTTMPEHFTLYGEVLGAVQPFAQYGSGHSYGTWQASLGIGDRSGAFSWRLSANHLDARSQPLLYVTLTRPAATSSSGIPVTGAFTDFGRTGAPIAVVGANGIEAQMQDTGTVKLAYDFANGWQATYTASLFHQQDNAAAESYLRDAAGNPVYSGSVNIGGYAYTIGASSFSNGVWHWNQTDLAQAVTLKSAATENWSWELVASDYAYLDDNQRVPGTALPGAITSGGAGTINRLDGTGWYTLDVKAVWRGWEDHTLSFGAHRDAETFSQTKFNTSDWSHGVAGAIATQAKGRTATNAFWLQDIWTITADVKAILGGRLEDWRAYSGNNYSATPVLNVGQPRLSTVAFSPKASLQWMPAEHWTVSASFGIANRAPTVTELYQAVTTGATLTVPNPNLKPERAKSYELAGEYADGRNRFRVSLFREDIANALLSQSAPLVTGSTTLYSYVQNVDATRVQGVEWVAETRDTLIAGLNLSASFTYADAKTVKDTAFAAAVGKRLPQVLKFKATAVATYHVGDALALTLAARYADRAFGTIDNTDSNSHTYTGFDGYLVLDARAHFALNDHWSLAAGIDNLNNRSYFLYHPFPQRTFVMEVHYAQ